MESKQFSPWWGYNHKHKPAVNQRFNSGFFLAGGILGNKSFNYSKINNDM
jgi:hypothetical protein